MNIGIIDADIVGKKKHRFPNLACMKISSYYKNKGYNVKLLLSYDDIENYDKVFISKVFTDTPVPKGITDLSWVEYGGTGFFYDKAEPLSYDVEHSMPDYHLYDDWINEQISNGVKRLNFKYYLDYSIGFLTKGCFRQCGFCVNKNSKRVLEHSPLKEFYDPTRKKICLLDDNFLGHPKWKEMLFELQETGKSFHFNQGLDGRLLTDEKCKLLFNSKYDGSFIFAFDNIKDKKLIEKKSYLIRRYCKKKGNNIMFYILCGFDKHDKYDLEFWKQDIRDMFERIFILNEYNFRPYITRYYKYKDSPLYGSYVNIARWCNQQSLFDNLSYKQFCEKDDFLKNGGKKTSATWRYYEQLIETDKECCKYVNIVPNQVRSDYTEW